MLEVLEIGKSFGGLHVLRGISVHLGRGEVLGLVGPNGSGKTTLFNIITGLVKPAVGRVVLEGLDITGLAPERIARLGIARTFQVPRPLGNLTMRDNIALALLHVKGRSRSLGTARREAEDILRLVEMQDKKDLPASRTTITDRKFLEVARGLALKPRIMLLDEVLSGLDSENIEKMLGLTKRISSEFGAAVLVIEHLFGIVGHLCSRIVVLNNGVKIAEGSAEELAKNKDVIATYLGEGVARSH